MMKGDKKMKIVFYNETLLSGGIEVSMKNLIEYLSQKHEIEIVYVDETKLDPNIVNLLSQYANVHKLSSDEVVEADVCIYCRLYMDYDFLKEHIHAKKQFLWVHSQPYALENCILDNKEFLDDIEGIICVSNTIQSLLNVDKESMVIHNFLPSNIRQLSEEDIPEDVFKDDKKLKFITVSRLSKGKGFERVYNFVRTLKNNNVGFEYIIIGKGRAKEQEYKNLLKDFEEVKFLGYKDNPYPYIKKADFLVLLSDFESYSTVITEAKILDTPVITTNYQSAYEQVENDFNGIIVDLKDTDYSKYLPLLGNLPRYKKALETFEVIPEKDVWDNLLENKVVWRGLGDEQK